MPASGRKAPPEPGFRAELTRLPATHAAIQEAYRALPLADQSLLWAALVCREGSPVSAEELARALRRLGAALASQSVPEIEVANE